MQTWEKEEIIFWGQASGFKFKETDYFSIQNMVDGLRLVGKETPGGAPNLWLGIQSILTCI